MHVKSECTSGGCLKDGLHFCTECIMSSCAIHYTIDITYSPDVPSIDLLAQFRYQVTIRNARDVNNGHFDWSVFYKKQEEGKIMKSKFV